LRTFIQARNNDEFVHRRVPGFHLEGPWISAVDGYRGAHPKEHVRIPKWSDFQRLQEAANGMIKLVTLSPELPGAIAFIEKLSDCGIVVGVGHTSAEATLIAKAFQAGARLSTHLGNGLPENIHRHFNPIWSQLSHQEMYASLIADGHHIPQELFQTVLHAKGKDRTILVSDASTLAGLPPGRYRQWEQDVEIMDNGRLNLAGTPYLAGSGCFLDRCVANAAGYLNDLPAAIEMASINPCHLLGLDQPELAIDSVFEFVLFDRKPDGSIHIRYSGL
jgi:N-acetylglucosamine-6-phosphate deacetylase